MINVQHIADQCDLSLGGDSSLNVDTLAYAKEASPPNLAVAFSKKEVEETRAQVVLAEPCICLHKTLLFCSYDGLYPALCRVVQLFTAKGILPNYAAPIKYVEIGQNLLVGDNFQLGTNSQIDPFVTIGNNVQIGNNCRIEPHVFIGSNTQIGDNCILHAGSCIGSDSFLHYVENRQPKSFIGIGRTILNNNVEVGYNTVIQRGTLSNTIIGNNVLIGNLVVIAHDAKIGENCRIVCQSGIAGGAKLGNNVLMLGQSAVVNEVTLGDNVIVFGKSAATKNIASGKKISGVFGREHIQELQIQARLHKLKREK